LINNLRDNIIFSAKELMDVAQQQNVTNIPNMDKIGEAETLSKDIAQMIEQLPKNDAFQEVLNKYGDSLGLQGGISGTEFLFKNAVRISEPDYVPSDEDKMWARAKTTGIEKVSIELFTTLKVVFYDIGGQRSERKKWPKIFNNVGLVIFMVALNEYDMVLEEDEKKNRLHESLKIWEKLTKSPHFHNASFILLFNKVDIFEKKLAIKPLNQMFVIYDDFAKGKGDNKLELGWKFLEDLFRKRFHAKNDFETFTINSTDKNEFERVWVHITGKIDKIGNQGLCSAELNKGVKSDKKEGKDKGTV